MARGSRCATPASGSTPAELPRIFERFYRGSRANEARGSGSGLGLAIVRSIVDMHGGRVAVESQLGRGSRFVVTLPRDPRETRDARGERRRLAADAIVEPVIDELAAPGAMPVPGEKVADSSPPDASRLNPGTSP